MMTYNRVQRGKLVTNQTHYMQLGPIQTQWLVDLRAHPERQTSNCLGKRINEKDNNFKFCCLGQLELTACAIQGRIAEWNSVGSLISSCGSVNSCRLLVNFKDYALRSSAGLFKEKVVMNNRRHNSLAGMNDNGVKWPQIAAYIEANPENVFTRSV